MKIVCYPKEMRNLSISFQRSGKRVGLVPTMGALHEGHLSLLDISQKLSDISVMSIFVNPTQFGQGEDFNKYPRCFEKDCTKAEDRGCDVVFAPRVEDMYPENHMAYVDMTDITEIMEGKLRPGHFRGVTTVVMKLINIVSPQISIFGQKDAQQYIVLKKMVDDLNMNVRLIAGPIIREADGLAMSSRNSYLTEDEREDVPSIYKGLCEALNAYDKGERICDSIISIIRNRYKNAKYFKTEYIMISDIILLKPIKKITGKALISVACKTTQTHTRLIDNLVVGGQL